MDFLEDMKLAVKRGAHWMDETNPNWVSSINLDNLNMAHCQKCVLGQAALGDYWESVEQGSGSPSDSDFASEWAISHGFDVDYDIEPDNYNEDIDRQLYTLYAALEGVWAEEIKNRLDQ